LAGLRAKHTAEMVRGLTLHHGALPGKLFNEKRRRMNAIFP